MKRLLVLWFSLAAAVWAADVPFWQQLTPEERRAAGVERLTPEQQAALNVQAERFAREGARQVREQAKAEVKQEVRAEVQQQVRAEAEKKVQTDVQKEVKKREAAKIGLKPNEKDEIIRTRIVGEFKGWTGTTLFRLENGQIWMQEDKSDALGVEPAVNPEVEIRAALLGGWKLYYLPKNCWVRVRRVQ